MKKLYLLLLGVLCSVGMSWGTDIVWDFSNLTAASFTNGASYSFTATDGETEMRYSAGSSDAIIAKKGETSGYLKENGTTGSATVKDIDNTTNLGKTRLIRLFVSGRGKLTITCNGTNGKYKVLNGSANGTTLISALNANTQSDEINVTASLIWIETSTKGYITQITWSPSSALPDAATPSITTQPQSVTYNEDEEMTALSVVASVTDAGSLSYQWYKDDVAINGATSASYTPTEAGTYYVKVTNTLAEHNAVTTTSANAVITITHPSYYIAANGTWCDSEWDPAGTEMTYEDGVYTYTTTVPTNTADNAYEFKITDGTWNNTWGGANVANSCGFGSHDGNATFKTAVETTITITFDPSKNTEGDNWKTISVVANKPLHEIPYVASSVNDWAFALMDETDGTKWMKTYKLVELPAGNIEFKYSKANNWNNGVWWEGSNGSNATYNVAEAGLYDVTFEYDPCTPTANVILVKKATQTDVTEATTWDWTKAASGTPALDGDGFKATANNQLMALIDGIENSNNFKSDALVMGNSGDYAIRGSSNKCFQGKSLKFHTTVSGLVTINARRAGGSDKTCNLTIGDKNIGYISTTTQNYTAFVSAGDVEISVEGDQPVRIFSMTFTPAKEKSLTQGFGMMYNASNKIELLDAEATAYFATYADGIVTLTELDSKIIPANTVVLIHKPGATSTLYRYTTADAATNVEDNCFVRHNGGSDHVDYVLAEQDDVVAFYKYADCSVNSIDNYNVLQLPVEPSLAPAMIRIVAEPNTATVLIPVFGDKNSINNNQIYTIMGVPVKEMSQPGIYILNGQKIVVK